MTRLDDFLGFAMVKNLLMLLYAGDLHAERISLQQQDIG